MFTLQTDHHTVLQKSGNLASQYKNKLTPLRLVKMVPRLGLQVH